MVCCKVFVLSLAVLFINAFGHPIKAYLRGNATNAIHNKAEGQLSNATQHARRLGGVPFQCVRGKKAEDNCRGTDGSCTPYPFQPDTKAAQGEPSWQDTSPFNTYAFVPYNENSYQAYQSPGEADVWVVHGHDRAGAQATDCGGDVHYFEHFEDAGNTKQHTCNKQWYPAQNNWCYFDHPGTGQTFGQYQCGWWRGYNNAWDASLWMAWDNIGVDAQGATSVKDTAMAWLRKCDNCPGQDGTLHTFRDAGKPIAWFTGVIFPWVCSWTDKDTSTLPWTGEVGKKCYCDNEPWGGRNFGSNIPNHYLAVVSCAKYENEYGMHCDMINFKCAKGKCSGASITAKNFWVKESSFR